MPTAPFPLQSSNATARRPFPIHSPSSSLTMTHSSKNNKFFLCFRPVVMLDSSVPSDPPHLHQIHNSLPPKRKLSRVIKAMLFESILNRTARRKNRSRRDSSESDSSYSTTFTEDTSSTGDDRSIWSQTSVDISSIQEISPESTRSSLSLSDPKFIIKSKSCPSEAKPRKRSPRNNSDCSGIYMLLLSLILTVFLGKILGIMFTLICLYSCSVFKKRYLRQKTERREAKKRNHSKGRVQ